ncbi:cytochrome P450 [Saccharopolyspora phatthalungensis]|uniref:Cytochrome P450 n=1 Tax=Saccharopolyspora phatthalungensis TaxID=664693 RepID=A0A840QJT7_9PSEU|nr:cytochrome P450 [Saccharopolyspora phatthalungensis]MBB5159459.1 cytochrome P450 [Saccharopolyspora phatthalungensis]
MSEDRTATPPFNPLDAAHLNDPDGPLAVARTRCPVSFPRPNLASVVTDEDVRYVLSRPEVYSNRGNFAIDGELELPAQLITMIDPPEHTELRGRLLRWFAPPRLRALRPEVERIVDKAMAGLPASGEVDLYESFVRAVPASVVFAFIGLPEHLWRDLEDWTDVINETMPEPLIDLPEMGNMIQAITEVVDRRRAGPPELRDVIDGLLHPQSGEQELSNVAAVTHIMQLILAATDTTRSLILNTVYSLLATDQWQTLARDRSKVANAVEESLRLDTPLQFVLRTAVREDTIGDTVIPAETKVLISLQSGNRDEQSWGPDAEEFRLDRDAASAHLAFGRGIHTCIGAPLARLESVCALNALLDAYPRMSLSDSYQWEKVRAPMMRRPKNLLVVLG